MVSGRSSQKATNDSSRSKFEQQIMSASSKPAAKSRQAKPTTSVRKPTNSQHQPQSATN